MTEPLWYAVRTQPCQEFKALSHLQRHAYQAYLPRYAKTIRHARKTQNVIRPFFPRYLFLKLDLTTTVWRSVRSTVGVSDIVAFGDQPAPLPPGAIETLKLREDADGFVQLMRKSSLMRGDSGYLTAYRTTSELRSCSSYSDEKSVSC